MTHEEIEEERAKIKRAKEALSKLAGVAYFPHVARIDPDWEWKAYQHHVAVSMVLNEALTTLDDLQLDRTDDERATA